MVALADKVDISGVRIREDGYLVADARVARTGTQVYTGAEVGRPDLKQVVVYRPEEEVFSDEAMASFAHRPVTNDHPPTAVTADNWKRFAVGQTSDETRKEGKFLRVPLMVADKASIDLIKQGKQELSAGYLCDLKWKDGSTPEGETYNAIQTNIRGNHIAIVQNGRAGSACRIGDSAARWGSISINPEDEMADTNLRTVLVDGLSVQTTDQGAQAIERLLSDKARLEADLDSLRQAHTDALKAKDTELASKDAEIDSLSAKIPDQTAMDKLVEDRAALIATAARIAPDVKATGLSDADLRKAVVKAKLGDEAIKDKSEAYVDARFDILAEAPPVDTLRQAMTSDSPIANVADALAARQAAFDRLQYFDANGCEMEVN